ncbi:Por secretion system C-terminal sorting domain-containing protein [Chryseobacterium soldanellicola]|uniref:Por secretion system C-terminal sorting domain-containing protein n=1 Tax=Chryseobacterium soldanellicola TaxID=311333 RepID=A0A1H0XVG4_9FLAO|nr:T9SS-dependent M36 family metallopeptidase [Chryseobacterium soldanellicola]SDQ06873.1 Por secretion system C-terminal sorting domain-containing protein [Chryseobacterium soldanellicola]
MKKIQLPLLMAALAVLPSSNLFSQENEKLIKDYISQNKIREYKKSDLANFIIENVDDSKSLHGNVVKFQQTYNGFPVYSSVGTALIKDNKVVYYTDNFVKNYGQAASGFAVINKNTALSKIADDLGNQDISNLSILGFFEQDNNNSQSAKQRLVYANDTNGNLRLAYEFTLKEPKSSNYWNILVDAGNGEIIGKNNLTVSCNFYPDAYSHDHSNAEIVKKNLPEFLDNYASQKSSFSILTPDNASYNIFALPIEAPTFGSRSVVSNPWILTSSPEGWHSDGTNHYTNTRGNNVYAYEDTADADAPGFSPDGGATRNFNFPYSTNGTPAANQSAAITNLFYMNNKVHDVFYKFGFTESARNFQQNNFGLGGVGNDYVEAEAQDGGGTNNANFGTPADGGNGVMQMYLWSSINRMFLYNAPGAAVPRQPNVGTAQFGPALNAAGVTGNVQLSSVLDGCTALPAGSLTGKIGLVERGTCAFTVKVKNAQNAGATAAIIYNAPTSAAVGGMSGTDATITIPSVLIDNTEGEYIKSQLSASTTVNVTLKNDPATSVTPDGDFDNGIITHEYGHGISNRLTGDGYTCLSSSADKEQMGEGWSDFFAIMLTNQPGDNASVPRGMGTYATGQLTTGGGIRPAKYSPDFSVNNYTYGSTNGMEFLSNGVLLPNVHSIGFVWATMLWDLHWQYVAKYGYSSDVTANATNGSSRVLQMVTNGLKLQACYPTFIDGRNAILAADLAATGGADKCMIWKAFAKRGLGVSASAGSKTNINDQVEDFTVPSECLLATNEVKAVNNSISIYPNPAKNEFFINFPNNTLGKVSVEIYDMSGKLVSSEDKISPDAKKAISTDKLVNGTYMVKVKGLAIEAASKVVVKK